MDVDTSEVRDVWLVKVPKYIANVWKDAPQKSDLGKLYLPKNFTGKECKLKFVLDPKTKTNTDNGKELPNEHSLSLQQPTQQRMIVLAETNLDVATGPTSLTFEGNVELKGEIRPRGDLSYMNLKTTSIREASKPARTATLLDKAVTLYKPRGAIQLAHEADLRRRKEEAKKTIREDKEIVQGRLFKAFEKKQYYNIKDLVKLTNQPAPYLKEVLKEICNYCFNGANKNMWELKPEYRHYKT